MSIQEWYMDPWVTKSEIPYEQKVSGSQEWMEMENSSFLWKGFYNGGEGILGWEWGGVVVWGGGWGGTCSEVTLETG